MNKNEVNNSKRTMCNACGKWFDLAEDKIEKTNLELEEGLCEVQYFVCEHCKQVYLIYIQTKETELLQQEYMNYSRKMNSCYKLGQQPKKKLVNNYNRAKRKITNAQKLLLKKYENVIVVS